MRLDEKRTIKSLECCISGSKECEGCPYSNEPKCGTQQRIDALALIRIKNDKIKSLEKKLREARQEQPPFIVKKVIDAVKSKASRNASSCMATGIMREIFTIRGSALDEIAEEFRQTLGGTKNE